MVLAAVRARRDALLSMNQGFKFGEQGGQLSWAIGRGKNSGGMTPFVTYCEQSHTQYDARTAA